MSYAMSVVEMVYRITSRNTKPDIVLWKRSSRILPASLAVASVSSDDGRGKSDGVQHPKFQGGRVVFVPVSCR